MLKISITIEGSASELAARLKAVAAALEDEPAQTPSTVDRVSDRVSRAPEPAQDEPPAPEVSEPTLPRRNGQTAEQAAAHAAYLASLPPRPVKPEPAPRASVRIEVPLPKSETFHEALHEADAPAPSPVNGVEVAGWTGRQLFDQVKDDPERLRWYEAFGRERGFPRLMLHWSPGMVTQARAASPA